MSDDIFSIKKLAKSPFTGLYWVKTIMMGLGLAFLIFVGYGVYKAYIKPEPTTTQHAEEIINKTDNHYNQPKAYLGCASVPVRLYRQKIK